MASSTIDAAHRAFIADIALSLRSAELAPLERLGLTVYDVPTYHDLDLVVSKPRHFGGPQYGITFKNVTGRGWTGNFTDTSSGILRRGYQDFLFFDAVHPTALAHQLTADIANHILTTAVPSLITTHAVSSWV